jgi:hypothetical protein
VCVQRGSQRRPEDAPDLGRGQRGDGPDRAQVTREDQAADHADRRGGALGRIRAAEKFSNADEQLTFQVSAEGAHRVVVLRRQAVLGRRGGVPQGRDGGQQPVGEAGLVAVQGLVEGGGLEAEQVERLAEEALLGAEVVADQRRVDARRGGDRADRRALVRPSIVGLIWREAVVKK